MCHLTAQHSILADMEGLKAGPDPDQLHSVPRCTPLKQYKSSKVVLPFKPNKLILKMLMQMSERKKKKAVAVSC